MDLPTPHFCHSTSIASGWVVSSSKCHPCSQPFSKSLETIKVNMSLLASMVSLNYPLDTNLKSPGKVVPEIRTRFRLGWLCGYVCGELSWLFYPQWVAAFPKKEVLDCVSREKELSTGTYTLILCFLLLNIHIRWLAVSDSCCFDFSKVMDCSLGLKAK